MDAEELNQAIELAAALGLERAVATDRQVDRLRDQLRRLLDELPGHVCVQELREHLEPDAGEPDPED